ncbi:MAG: PQQ-dependent sugar dehydrogenase, partial [Candidatus Methanoperedens sp.]|nr:PQQ-dependent sugar dehydrogenase [Candidatus Methanoperedens nitroreducens]MCX9077753.1 PQQ-dependent sugar dehydrogenase [Candidatus Methanoperedens sp.]
MKRIVISVFILTILGAMASAAPNITLTLNSTMDGGNATVTSITGAVLLDRAGAIIETAVLPDNMTAQFDLNGITPGDYFIEVNGLADDRVPTRIDSNESDINQSVGMRLINSVIGNETTPAIYRIKARSGGRHPVVNYNTGANETKYPFVIVSALTSKIEVRAVNTSEELSNFSTTGITHPFQTWILGSNNHGIVYNGTDTCSGCHGNLAFKQPNYANIIPLNTSSGGWCFKCHNGPGGDASGFVDPAVVAANGTIAGTVTNASGSAIADATVAADSQSNNTDINGNYTISIGSGTYTLTAGAAGYQSNSTSVTVTSGATATQNFALTPSLPPEGTFNISGFKIDNSTGMGLANWNISLTKPDGTIQNNVTDAGGMYQFMNLSNGTYTIAEQMQPGWMNVSVMPMAVTINGTDMMNQNFTNRQLQPGEKPNISGANIISILPSTEIVNNQAGENRTFSITVDQLADISWQINGTEVSSATNVISSSYVSSAAVGTWNVTAVASNINGTDIHKWDWIVRPPTAVNIAIQSFAFNPANITVLKGTSVTWTNNDVDAHTVTSDTGVFDSGTLNQGNTFEFMFNDTGTFKYHCALHPTMHGEIIVIAAPAPTIPPMEEIGIGLELVADNFTSPVALVSPEDGTGRRFIVDQIGLIKIINTSGQVIEEPFLDLRSRIVALAPQYDERGLLGLAFHPNFSQNGRFFVYYSSPLRTQAPSNWNHTSIVSEFKVLQDNQNRANDSSERVLLQIDKPQANHNAGQIAFGPDGYLYIPLGDGGGADDFGIGHPPPGNGQNTSTLLGKILRIDVDNGDPYGIPPDNPYVGKDGLDEIFASGFRNPFHISFDTGGNHSLFASNAGQNAWEEVDIVARGGNYGWNIKEGAHCFDPNNPNLSNQSCPDVDANGQPLIDPVIEYANARQPGGIGVVVVGGYVYRGSELPQFNGNYIFGDFSKGPTAGNGSLFVARPPSSGEGMWSTKELRVATSSNGRINEFVRSFGQDADHELYVLTSQMLGPTNNTGKIYKIKQFTIPNNFTANLSSNEIVQQPVVSSAKGNATFELSDNGTRLHYKIMVENIENVSMAHIHLAPAGVDGPVVAWLYPEVPPAVLIPGRFDGLLVEGNITSINLSGPLAGQPLNALLGAMIKGNTYVNVHTNQYPGGEIRGQITASGVLQELRSITISPSTAIMNVGNSQVFNATALDQNGAPIAGINITFTSNDTAVGTISPETSITGADGIATAAFKAAGAGTAMVIAASGNITGSANVTVSAHPSQPNVTSFELTPGKTAALKGSTITITIKALNANVTDTTFNEMANITVNASKNASAVIYQPNVTFSNGIAILPVTSNMAQFVTVTATSGSITGSTEIAFADMVFDLDPGWNLISVPNFADPGSVDMILKNVKNNGVAGYDPGNKTFSTPADLQPLYGYWINVTAPNQSIGFIADTNIRSVPPSRDLFEGWNLIGVV